MRSFLIGLFRLLGLLGIPHAARAADAGGEQQNAAIHGQTTFVLQGTPGFSSPYAGPNSLTPHQRKETVDVTLFVGVRPWKGAEIWLNPEVDQGFGLSNTLGVAGFPSAEAADGGIGVLVGDGRLPHPGPEAIGEVYYDWKPLKPLDVTFDYQIVGNPGYNRDRGPAHVFAVRLYGQH